MPGGGLGRVTHHPKYYLRDGSVSFLTGGTLFRVHQSFFGRESEVFSNLFTHAAEEDPQSGTDARPFTLDVKPDEFAQFLWVWYDTDYSYRQQTKENWTVILRLATRWHFPKIKELAIRELDVMGLSPAERIAIYNEHGIDDDRLLNSYVEICKSPTVPTEKEGHLMQMETLINVLQAREDAQRKAFKLRHESPTSAGLEDETLREIVSRFFKTGLSPRSNGAPTGSEVQAYQNGERTQGSLANSTITLGDPQVPDRKAQSSGPSSHVNGLPQTGDQRSNLAGSSDKQKKEDKKLRAEEDNMKLIKARQEREREEKEKVLAKEREEEKARLAKEMEQKEKAEREKEKQEREREEREKQQRAKEKEERERLERLKQEKEKEKGKKPEEQKRPESPLRKAWPRY